MNATADLPASFAELRQPVLEQRKQLEQQSLFIGQLLEQVRLARHQHFGVRSERFSLDQLALAFNEAEAAAAESADAEQPDLLGTVAVPAHRRTKGGRRPLPKTFTRVDIVHEIDEGECRCGECRTQLTAISEKVTGQLDIQPARVQVLRHVRKTYACKACVGKPVTAPMPNQPIPRSLASTGTLAHVAVAKYLDGLSAKLSQSCYLSDGRSSLLYSSIRRLCSFLPSSSSASKSNGAASARMPLWSRVQRHS